ncbi:MAG: hypothetical protein GX580_14615 [Candidatus Hydrogenedens sp.]|nr:neutral/alkaline non-lysosomal ceramidase N-terminal domain-containing protein [Candidatus Hydrogenedentota bacterium]NLF58860.1 hypothetical protein [Candidatus Hydrogenedens sp.]
MLKRLFILLAVVLACAGGWAQTFKAGVSVRDITPQAQIPMWGYGARHDHPGTGTIMPLHAKALVLDCGNDKVALVGLDLGRGPTYAMMEQILEAVKTRAGVGYVLAVGSHTHHGPAIELLDEPGLGKGKFDEAVKYAKELPGILSDMIVEAANSAVPAKIGFGYEETDLNRNRHTKKEPKPRDPRLSIIRVDNLDGKTLAVVVNLAAHPTIENIMDRRWSPDWPGYMQKRVGEAMETTCVFLQGAAGDMSPNTTNERRGAEGFGNAAAEKAVAIARAITPAVPENPGLTGVHRTFTGETRLDFNNRVIRGTLSQFFFPEMMAMLVEIPDNKVTLRVDTVLINGDLAIVGGSGELFSDLSTQIKARSAVPQTLVLGYCNGHCMYVPTLPAIEEGGYGADATVSWVPVGTGEKLVEQAVADIAGLKDGSISQ